MKRLSGRFIYGMMPSMDSSMISALVYGILSIVVFIYGLQLLMTFRNPSIIPHHARIGVWGVGIVVWAIFGSIVSMVLGTGFIFMCFNGCSNGDAASQFVPFVIAAITAVLAFLYINKHRTNIYNWLLRVQAPLWSLAGAVICAVSFFFFLAAVYAVLN